MLPSAIRLRRFDSPQGPVVAVRDADGWRPADGTLAAGFTPRPGATPVDATAKTLIPADIRQIWCIGLNYRRHATETRAEIPAFPVLFSKGLGALNHPGDPVLLPSSLSGDRTDFEVELAVVIGRPGKNIPRARALEHVAGFTIGVDVSERAWQKKGGGGQWTRGKTFDTFAPLGPELVTPDEYGDGSGRRLRLAVNGVTMQHSSTDDMIFDVPALIEFLSRDTTLVTGTVILTGTPEGVGMARNPPVFLRPGDRVDAEIDGLGALSFGVEAAPPGLPPLTP